MFYEGLEKTDLAAILATLTKDLGEEYVQLVIAKNPPNAIKRQVDWLHTMCCLDSHNKDGYCAYYAEELLDSGWNEYSHRSWLDVWKSYTLTRSPQRLQELMYITMHLLNEIRVTCGRDPALATFLTELLKQNPHLFIPTPPQTDPVPAEPSAVVGGLTDSVLSPEE